MGKSYLADRFAFENVRNFPGGYFRLVLDPKAPSTAEALLEALADRLDIPAGPDRAAAVRERLRQPRTLLHVENADSKPAGKVVAALLQNLGGCAVIVSGRLRDLGRTQGWRQIQVEPFAEPKALQQLWQELGREPEGAEREEHEELVHALGFLPLAIHLAAGHLSSGRSAKRFLHKLRKHGLGLEPADPAELAGTPEVARKILSTSFSLSLEILVEDLGEAAERLLPGLRALSHAPLTGFGRSLGAAIAGLSEEDFEDLVARAQALSILLPMPHGKRPDGAWIVHPLLSELLRETANPEEAFLRMTTWFIARFPKAK
ncbi:MAG TPA: metallophosphatase, partial [Thermoanaerobaculia bacterium]|nr:metallophosphatase [Thermoanaerobaculia bacterium]